MTTPLCNLNCCYCGGSLPGMPADITYDTDRLKQLIQKDPEAIIAFYGGEPLLRSHVVKHFLTHLPAKHFVINTNGYFIERITEHLSDFDTILLSIDGRESVTNRYREKGCYQQVMHAVDIIKDSDFNGEIIARMAVSKHTDIYQDVMHLLDIFPLVHWQLDVVWSALWELKDFQKWIEESYTPGLKKLIKYWITSIRKGSIPGIIPLRGIMTRMLYNLNGLPCQAGAQAVAITTDGQILACPIAPGYQWNHLGTLSSGFQSVDVDEPCPSCDVYKICGGRCLFANKERLWGTSGFNEICIVTKYLIHELQQYTSLCESIKEDIFYPPFNNTTEIIP